MKTTFTLDDAYSEMENIACGRDIYSKKHFRTRLKDELKTLEFISRFKTKDILCFRSTADKIIEEYHNNLQNDDGTDPRTKVRKLIDTVVKVIKDDAKCAKFADSTFYPTIHQLGEPDPNVPGSMHWLMEGLIVNSERAEAWAQQLLHQVCPRVPISPFMFGLAIDLKKRYYEKTLNELLATIGVCVPYKVSQDYLWSWLKRQLFRAETREAHLHTAIQFVADNFDLAMVSAIRIISIHVMGATKVYSDQSLVVDVIQLIERLC